MTRYLTALTILLIFGTAFSTEARAQIGQTSFVVPKPKLVILEAAQNGTLESLLLAVGLDKKLEEEFPSNNSNSPKEVIVQIFAKIFLGIPVRVFPLTVIRVNGQTWAEALGRPPLVGGGGGFGEGILIWEPEPITFPAGELCGGGPSYSRYEDFKTVVICGHAPND